MALATGNIISPILGGALKEAGDEKYPEVYENQAYVDIISTPNQPEKIGSGFSYAADVMSFICLTVAIFYICLGWLFRPKSDFDKMKSNDPEFAQENAEHDYEHIVFGDEAEAQGQKSIVKNLFTQARGNDYRSRTGSFNIESM